MLHSSCRTGQPSTKIVSLPSPYSAPRTYARAASTAARILLALRDPFKKDELLLADQVIDVIKNPYKLKNKKQAKNNPIQTAKKQSAIALCFAAGL